MSDRDEKKEIVVNAPSKSTVSVERKVEKATVKALEEERFNVIHVSQKMGKYYGVLSIGVGAALLIALAYMTLAVGNNVALLDSVAMPVVFVWTLAGLISIVVGFLLMGSE